MAAMRRVAPVTRIASRSPAPKSTLQEAVRSRSYFARQHWRGLCRLAAKTQNTVKAIIHRRTCERGRSQKASLHHFCLVRQRFITLSCIFHKMSENATSFVFVRLISVLICVNLCLTKNSVNPCLASTATFQQIRQRRQYQPTHCGSNLQ